jgi:hypothetical protein
MRMKRIIGESQALLNEKSKQKQAEKKAQQNTFNHLMNEHRDQQSVYKSQAEREQEKQNAVSAARWASLAQMEQTKEKANGGGSKPLLKPTQQDGNPPWWETAWNNVTNWIDDKVIQPITKAYQKTTQTVNDIVTSTTILIQNTYQDVKKKVTQQWNTSKTFVNNQVVKPVKEFVQRTETSFEIYKEHGWITSSLLMTQNQLDLINQTGDNMQTYVDGITNNHGDIWMDEYMSGVIFLPAGNSRRPFSIGPFIFLNKGWDTYSNPLSMPLTHEFGHVWDFKTGSIDYTDIHPIIFIKDLINTKEPHLHLLTNGYEGGVSDQLNTFIGGTVVSQDGNRIEDGTGYKYISDNHLWDGHVIKDPRVSTDDVFIQNHATSIPFNVFNNESYGNNSTGDYLCETLNATIYNPNAIPNPLVQQWLEDTIRAQTDALINGTPVTPIPTITQTSIPSPTATPTSQPSVTIVPNNSSTPSNTSLPSNHVR